MEKILRKPTENSRRVWRNPGAEIPRRVAGSAKRFRAALNHFPEIRDETRLFARKMQRRGSVGVGGDVVPVKVNVAHDIADGARSGASRRRPTPA
jgi:hypothetical protein